jgi:bacterial/archaeal transporter family protein
MNAKLFPYVLAVTTLVFWGIAPIFGKLGLVKINPFTALALRSFVIALIMLVVMFIRGGFKELASMDIRSAFFIGLEGVFASLIGHFAYYYALSLGDASRVVPIVSAYSLITILASIIFLSEKVTITRGAGAVLVVIGVFLLRI